MVDGILIARREHINAEAFVCVKNDEATVRGSFFSGCSKYSGPVADIQIPVPPEFQLEIEVLNAQAPHGAAWKLPKSMELEAFCTECFNEAAEDDSWFKMFLPE